MEYYNFDRGDNYNTPPEETIEGVDVNIVKSAPIRRRRTVRRGNRRENVKGVADQLDAEELLKEEL